MKRSKTKTPSRFIRRCDVTGLRYNANTMTNLIPIMYEGLDVVSRELFGLVGAVQRDSRLDKASVNQNVNVPIVPAVTAADITPAVNAPDTGDQTFGNVTLQITKSRQVPVRWNGEEQNQARMTGVYETVLRNQFTQAFRTLVNEMEADLSALHVGFSRAAGTAGTTPFGTANVLSDSANVVRILDDNGAPTTDRRMVLGSAAAANVRGVQSVLFKVNESGTEDLLRRGILGELHGLGLGISGAVKTQTKGTAASATTDATGYAVGATTLTLASAGTGTIVAGDVLTFAGDTNQYVVLTGDTDVSNGGTIVLTEPGLRVAMSAATKAITVVANSVRNMAFSQSAIILATRMPIMPEGGDSAFDVMELVDPASGLSFQVAAYKQYRQIHFEVGLAWGVKLIKPAHTALLLG